MEQEKFCKRCHRKLKDDKSKNLGFGKTCYLKFIKRKKSYLFDMEVEAVKIDKDDIKKFYSINSHFNKLSTNIAVIGDQTNFDNFIKKLKIPDDVDKIIKSDNKLTILIDDIETSYVKVEFLEDMKDYYFKKFI